MRSAVGNAGKAFNQSFGTASDLGGKAASIGGAVTPFFTSEMMNPQGIGQAGLAAETSAALGGAGGADAGIAGEAAQRASAMRNPAAFQGALDEASRNRMKAAAGASENIAAGNEQMKEQQRQAGAAGLEKMYGTDVSGQLESQGQEAQDINAQTTAGQSGWLQNALAIYKAMRGGGNG